MGPQLNRWSSSKLQGVGRSDLSALGVQQAKSSVRDFNCSCNCNDVSTGSPSSFLFSSPCSCLLLMHPQMNVTTQVTGENILRKQEARQHQQGLEDLRSAVLCGMCLIASFRAKAKTKLAFKSPLPAKTEITVTSRVKSQNCSRIDINAPGHVRQTLHS